jgi:sacsin
MFDFVENCQDVAMLGQMAAFQAVTNIFHQPLDGTIIRIPLRSAAQATRSKIINRKTTISELDNVLKTFPLEFGVKGLLFMRHIEKLQIETAGQLIDIEVVDKDAIRS